MQLLDEMLPFEERREQGNIDPARARTEHGQGDHHKSIVIIEFYGEDPRDNNLQHQNRRTDAGDSKVNPQSLNSFRIVQRKLPSE